MKDSLEREVAKLYKASRSAKVDKLVQARKRWTRAFGVAVRQLKRIDKQLAKVAATMAQQLDGGKHDAQ